MSKLEVMKNSTQEIRVFPTTLAGMYQLANFIRRPDQNVHSVMRYIAETTRNVLPTLSYKIRNLGSVLLSNYSFYDDFDCTFLNIVWSARGQRLSDDCFNFKGAWYPREWRKYLRKCEDCGELFFDQEETPSGVLDYVCKNHIGYKGCCNDCVENNFDVRQCQDCYRWFEIDEMTYIYSDDDYVCDDCRDRGEYRQCDCCGEWFSGDDYVYVEDVDRVYCSESCAENDGNHWSDYQDCWVSDDNDEDAYREYISDYHDNKGYLDEYRTKEDKRVKQTLLSGWEVEVDGQSIESCEPDFYRDLLRKFKDLAVLEHDGSVAFEAITRPMSEYDIRHFDWETPFKYLRDNGWRAHDTSTCGRHFHYSVGYLGYNDKERMNNAKKICRFFQLYADDIQKIARRKFNNYCYDMRGLGEDVNKDTEWRKISRDRYWSVNLTNFSGIGTIEIRICKGTLKVATSLASWDFFLHIVRNAKRISWKNINNIKLWLKGIKDKNTIDYIKARHAFEGAF